jgi:hypothetical protein
VIKLKKITPSRQIAKRFSLRLGSFAALREKKQPCFYPQAIAVSIAKSTTKKINLHKSKQIFRFA